MPRPRVRNSCKAIIVRDGKLLVQINQEGDVDPWMILPGGGQHHGETILEAVKRECLEEINVEVAVVALRYMREYIGANHEFAATDGHRHQVEFLFECTIPDDAEPSEGSKPDSGQIGLAWIPLDELHEHPFYPRVLIPHIQRVEREDRMVYLGDVN